VALGQQLLYTLMSKGGLQLPPQPRYQLHQPALAPDSATGGDDTGCNHVQAMNQDWLQLLRHMLGPGGCALSHPCSNVVCNASRRVLLHRLRCQDMRCSLCAGVCGLFTRRSTEGTVPGAASGQWGLQAAGDQAAQDGHNMGLRDTGGSWGQQTHGHSATGAISARGFEELTRAMVQLDLSV